MPQQIQIRATDKDLKGKYSNVAKIGHTQEEFLIDFLLISENIGTLAARIILNPKHAKRLVYALSENIKKYEEKFGEIESSSYSDKSFGFEIEQERR